MIVASVYQRDNATHVDDLVLPDFGWSLRTGDVQEHVNRFEKCSVSVSWNHPNAGALVPGNVVRVVDDATDTILTWFTIREVRTVHVDAKNGDGARTVTATGPTGLERLDRGLVRPWVTELLEEPQSDRKAFNFAAPAFDASSWSTTLHNQPRNGYIVGRPIGYVDPFAEPVWPREWGATHPAETVYAIRDFSFTGSEPRDILFTWSADEFGAVYCDGVELDRQEPDDIHGVYPWTWRAGCVLTPDVTHRFAIEVKNTVSKGMFIVSCWFADAPAEEYPIFLSGINLSNPSVEFMQDIDPTGWGDPVGDFVGTWRVNAGPAEVPGFTFGKIARILIEEAQEMAAIKDVTLGFDDVEDSNGDPWPIISGFAPEVDQSVWKALEPLLVSHADVKMADEGLELLAYDKHTADGIWTPSGLTIAHGANLQSLVSTVTT